MQLLPLRAQFTTLLDRDDCTDALASTFLGQSMQRITRECRLPSMERLALFQPTAPQTDFAVPSDIVELIDVIVQLDPTDDGTIHTLDHLPYRQLIRHSSLLWPQYYSRLQAAYVMRGAAPAGSSVSFLYYGEFSPLDGADTDENEIMASSPDLVTYGALSLAGDYFEHPKADAWEKRYQQFLSQVIQLAQDIEWGGGSLAVQSAHGGYC
jgi:hypothetical protein